MIALMERELAESEALRQTTTKSGAELTGDAIRNIIRNLDEMNREGELLKYGLIPYEAYILSTYFKPTTDIPVPNTAPVEQSEKHLKKLIKHAKTPMERKAYEKQLNELYKKRKKRRNGYLL